MELFLKLRNIFTSFMRAIFFYFPDYTMTLVNRLNFHQILPHSLILMNLYVQFLRNPVNSICLLLKFINMIASQLNKLFLPKIQLFCALSAFVNSVVMEMNDYVDSSMSRLDENPIVCSSLQMVLMLSELREIPKQLIKIIPEVSSILSNSRKCHNKLIPSLAQSTSQHQMIIAKLPH